jgi:ankyrin repeat protein
LNIAAQALIEHPKIDVDKPGDQKITALYAASGAGHREIVKMLLAKSKKSVNQPDKKNVTPIAAAAENGHIEIVQDLVAAGADVNIRDNDGESVLGKVSRNIKKMPADTQQALITFLNTLGAQNDQDSFHPK